MSIQDMEEMIKQSEELYPKVSAVCIGHENYVVISTLLTMLASMHENCDNQTREAFAAVMYGFARDMESGSMFETEH